MIFPKSKENFLDEKLFKNPTHEYRGEPFWALNNHLEKDKLRRQIDVFEEMGIGGFHMHCRTGLDTEYMGEEYIECLRACIEKAAEKDMRAYLYDEDRWPSGFAGGLVTKDPKYRARFITFAPEEMMGKAEDVYSDSNSAGSLSGNGTILARYEIELENGCLKSYKRLCENEKGNNVWCAVLEIARESAWFNNQTYVDSLNNEAIEKFIEVTHEKFYESFKEYFGNIVPAIFTDEPQFTRKEVLGFAEDRRSVSMPYTDKLPELYEKEYSADFFETFPEIIWELPDGKVSLARYRYHNFVAEIFARSFADTVGKWCDEHSIALTGHMMEEPSLHSQTAALGEAMRSYRSFTLPGIDMLCDSREYSTAKQAQSATHQYGYEGVLSELYGVTGWNFDFRGHKLQGDWQAALGITNRVHHLSWYSMEGEAKRDYPASIFYQSPWYKQYRLVEDHFARVNTAMTRGKAIVKIGVIHPVESFWLRFGPAEQTSLARADMEEKFGNIIEWLIFNHLDFDFISESLLPDQFNGCDKDKFTVGEMNYETIIVPGCETIRRTTFDRLREFANKGGKVIFLGTAPRYIDAVETDECEVFAKQCQTVSYTKGALVQSLKENRIIEMRYGNGATADNLIYQMREDGDSKWLFIANGRNQNNKDRSVREQLTVKIKGCYNATLYDTVSGDIYSIPTDCKDGYTRLRRYCYETDSFLIRLDNADEHSGDISLRGKSVESVERLTQAVAYELDEPNVLLLDKAEYRFDNGEWQSRNDVFHIDDDFRDELGWDRRKSSIPQPWVVKDEESEIHSLDLRYRINSEIDVDDVCFAIERPELCKIKVNGKEISNVSNGYYVDECVEKIAIGKLSKGETVIEINMPFTKKTNVEWCFLLGQFGVKVRGEETTVIAMEEKIPFGDYTQFGMPFYSGNLSYICNVETEEGHYELNLSKFRGPLMSIKLDGKDMGMVAFSPYKIDLGNLSAGKHEIEVTSFGHRFNTFGALHHTNDRVKWAGPDAWRSTGEEYTKLYNLVPMGILKEPMLIKIKD